MEKYLDIDQQIAYNVFMLQETHRKRNIHKSNDERK